MASTASTTYQDYIEGKLIVAIGTGTTTGVTVKIKQVNGATPTWPTAIHRIKIVQKTATNNKVEKIEVAAGTSQSGQTVTLGTLTRALSLSDGTSFSGSAGTAQSFTAGADVFLAWDAHDAAQSVKKDIVNTFTGSGAVRGSSTTVPLIRNNSVTTAQREAMSPANGDMVYDTDLNQNYQYIGGAWAAVGDTGTADASTTVAGKVEIATAAQRAAGTATGETGAVLVPSNDALVKTSSGASDENKIPLLDSAGQLASGFIPASTAGIGFFGDGSDGDATISGDTSLTTDKYYDNLTINTGVTLNTVNWRVFVKGTLTLTGTGKIACNGGAGGNATNASGATKGAGGSAGAAVSVGYFPASIAGAAGGAGGDGATDALGVAGTAGTAGNAETNSAGGANGAAGVAGGAGGVDSGATVRAGGAAGAAGAATTISARVRDIVTLTHGIVLASGAAVVAKLNAGAGGSGGGGGGSVNSGPGTSGGGGGGGGSGGNGGYLYVAAKTVTGAGNLQANGGAGGNGGNGAAGTGTSGGGGGGSGGSGGSGGRAVLIYNDKSGWSGSITASGGAGGTAGTQGANSGGGTNAIVGTAGTAGTSGIALQLAI